jgi:hypothetical protein
MSANKIRQLTPDAVQELLPDANLALAVQSTLLAMRGQEAAIDLLERQACAQMKGTPAYRHFLGTSGIGKVLGLTIVLETGPVERFARVGNDASYSRLVGSERLSNAKRKGRGNTKSGNKYLGLPGSGQLRCALQPHDQALLPAQAGQDKRDSGHQDGGPQAGAGLLLHATQGQRLRGRASLRLKGKRAMCRQARKGVGVQPSALIGRRHISRQSLREQRL